MSQPEATKTVEKVRRELSAKSDTMQRQMRESKKPHTPPKKDDIRPGDSVRICSLGADATVPVSYTHLDNGNSRKLYNFLLYRRMSRVGTMDNNYF